MRPNLLAAFLRETTELEADIEHMYCDSLGFVTVAVGRKIESGRVIMAEALRYPFRRYGDGAWVSEDAIREEFARIKAKGGDYRAAKTVAKLYLVNADRSRIFERTVATEMEPGVMSALPKWTGMPLEAQWAVMSMAWNVGAYFLNSKSTGYWPSLHKMLKEEDYFGAASNCKINGRASTRNTYNRAHFLNALIVKVSGQDPNTLLGNSVLMSGAKVEIAAAKSPLSPDANAVAFQICLKELGLYREAIDGLFGKASQSAWKKYCKSKGVSSSYGATQAKLLAEDADVRAMIG